MHLDAGNIDVELVGCDLRQRGDNALADFDLAGRHHDLPVRRKFQPRRELRVGREADRELGGRGSVQRAISLAARSTARTMRLCDPQRQRLRSSAAFTSSLDGDGFCRSSAAALINMPEMQ